MMTKNNDAFWYGRRVDLVRTDISEEHVSSISGWKNPGEENRYQLTYRLDSLLTKLLMQTVVIEVQ
jgi:hypothetical protein